MSLNFRKIVLNRTIPLIAIMVTGISQASAHFLWIRIEADSNNKSPVLNNVHLFLSETPVPENQELLKFVDGVAVTSSQGVELPLETAEESREAAWLGALPSMLNAERDMGVKTRGDKTFRLAYTARMQTKPVKETETEKQQGLRVRLIEKQNGGNAAIQVLFNAKPIESARVRIFSESGEPIELKTVAGGYVEMPSDDMNNALNKGELAFFANFNEPGAGKSGDKTYEETRHYATWTNGNQANAPETSANPISTIGLIPEPAVNSFGGAVLGDWLYIYSGHIGKTHDYAVDTTTKTFRRFNLKDRKTWENLPISRDLQGVALVSDGKYLYRTGGMYASNPRGESSKLHSVADCERFDPETKTWKSLPKMPAPRSTHDSFVIGRKLFVAGGWDLQGSSDESDFHNQMLILDLDHTEKGWQEVEQPFERRALSVAESGGKLYVLGGLQSDTTISHQVDIFDPSTGKWSKGPDIPNGTKAEGFGTAAFTINNRLYYNGVTGPIYRLSQDGTKWEAVGEWHIPRITHRILPGISNDLIAVGGNVGRKQTPVIESLPVNLLND